MKWKVMISAPYMQPVIERFRPILEERGVEMVIPPVAERLSEAELLDWVGDIDGAICGDDRFTDKVLAAAPKLKVISKWGTGIDSIDREACEKRGIPVRNTPGAFSIPVADTVLGYMLCFARQLARLDRDMRAGRWKKQPGASLKECTLGVIGVGDVGKTVVRRALAFGMKVLGNDIVEMPPEFLAETGIEMTNKEDLLRRADFITLNCTLNPTSFHIISTAELSLVKPTAYIINTARGPLIDEPELVKALQAGKLAGAGLDVYEVEPLPDDSPLRRMENVMMAPHNANSSPEAWERVHHNTINNLLEVLEKSEK